MTSNEIIKAIRALANGTPTDIDISDFLYRNHCFYILSKLPSAQQHKRFIAEKALNRIAVKERYKALKPLFEKLNIPYAVIKGAVLSDMAYADPFARSSGDIDILIRKQDTDIIKDILCSLDFIQGRVTSNGVVPFSREEILFHNISTHQIAPYIKETKNPVCPYINLDVNTDIFWGESEKKADMDFVLSHREASSLFEIPFFKLNKEMEFISLCLHHYKDMNSLYLLAGGSFRLGLFYDIYYYLRNAKPNPRLLKEISTRLDVGKYIYVCIYHTQEIFDDPIMAPYLDAIFPEKDASLLDCFGLTAKERKSWDITLLERIFHSDLPQYVLNKLSQEEKDKIRINQQYM